MRKPTEKSSVSPLKQIKKNTRSGSSILICFGCKPFFLSVHVLRLNLIILSSFFFFLVLVLVLFANYYLFDFASILLAQWLSTLKVKMNLVDDLLNRNLISAFDVYCFQQTHTFNRLFFPIFQTTLICQEEQAIPRSAFQRGSLWILSFHSRIKSICNQKMMAYNLHSQT